ncbi:expressed unknown protein [Seminavis robusta]|uniref:Cytochrome b5 heme-binding domain-containing protein n=1 Tax=Seminavis robusta TaxID=568900 RepID=A0A9N8HUK7_9STRA|nr:expressed unknown protein [Seminavis robusta]|eukprot:Sro1767_g296270.1 n/a (326) ;mRNA; f:3619-4596
MVFYNRVYHLDEFIYIHKGGSEAMLRNCRKDATWAFENLQCIAMVPDHFEGMLNMCHNYIVGVIKDSPEDPCAQSEWVEPHYPYPDFDACDVYHNITCSALGNDEEMLPMDPQLVDKNMFPLDRRWTLEQVQATLEEYPVDMATNTSAHCYTILHDWVYDLGVSPLDGSAPFYLKHGNGWYPQEILRWCGEDMTQNFDALIDEERECVPDHTKGGMNVLSGYVVGVVKESHVDPCVYPPPTSCETFHAQNLGHYTYDNFDKIPGADCPVVIMDKVYDLGEFMQYHPGGTGQIRGACKKDVTSQCKSLVVFCMAANIVDNITHIAA